MRRQIKRLKLLFALLPIMSIVFYVLTANHSTFADQSFASFDIYKQISDSAQPVAGKHSPADYTAAENFAIAADVYLKAESVESTTTGNITAMGFYKQTVRNTHIKKDGHIFAEAISLSAVASVAEQRYFKDGALLYRKGNASGSSVKSWADAVTELTVGTYRQRYGVVPQEITKYSVTKESVLSGELVSKNADGTYTYTMDLDAELAQLYARYEMTTFAGVSSFPSFYSCRLEFTVDETWHIVKLESYDTYKIDMMGGIKCNSHLTEVYTFENVTMPERAQIFVDYVPTGNTGDIGQDKGPADYLSEAFGDYISGGRALCLTADFTVAGEVLPLRGHIDLTKNDYRFMLGDDIFAAYTGEDVYVALGQNKYTVNLAQANAVIKALTGDRQSTASGSFALPSAADLLSLLFENHTITETDTHVFVRLPFTLFGIDLDVNMGLKKIEGGVTADTIQATIGYKDITATADVQIADSVTMPTLTTSEYTSLLPLLTAVQNTVLAPAHDLHGEFTVTAKGKTIPVTADVTVIQTEKGADADGTLYVQDLPVRIVYKDETVYVQAKDYGFACTAAELPALIKDLSALLPASAQQDALAVLPQILPQLLPADLSINTALGMLKDLTYDGKTLALTVTPQTEKAYTLRLTHGQTLQTLSLNGVSVQGVDVNADVTRTDTQATAVEKPQGSFINGATLRKYAAQARELINSLNIQLSDLTPFVTPLQNLTKAETLLLHVTGNIRAPIKEDEKQADGSMLTVKHYYDEPFEASVTTRLPRENESMAFACAIKVSGQTVNVVLTNGTVYIQTGAVALRLPLAEVQSTLSDLSPLLGSAATFVQNIAYLLTDTDIQATVKGISAAQTLLADIGKADGLTGILDALRPYMSMPSFDLETAKKVLGSVTVENGTFGVNIPVGETNAHIAITQDGTNFTSLSLSDLTVKGVAIQADGNITLNAPLLLEIDDGDYYDVAGLTAFAPALRSLLVSPAVRLHISDGTLNTPFISGAVKGNAELLLTPALAAHANLTVGTHTLAFDYRNDTFYLKLNDINVRFILEEMSDLSAHIRSLLVKGGMSVTDADGVYDVIDTAVQTVTILQKLTGGKTLHDIVGYIDECLPSGDGWRIGAHYEDLSVTAVLSAQKDDDGNDVLGVEIVNINYGSYIGDSNFRAALSPIAALSTAAPVDEDYVSLAALDGYIAPVVSLKDKTHYAVEFYGTVIADKGTAQEGTTKIGDIENGQKGVLRIERTQGFMQAYAHIPLSGKIGTHDIQLYVLDNTDYTANAKLDKTAIDAYLDYNGFTAHVDYASVLGVFGSLCDILNVQLPEQAEELLREIGYTHYSTNVFTSMDIKGLDGLRTTLAGVLGTGEDVADVAQDGTNAALGFVTDGMIDDILHGIRLGFTDGMLRIDIDNGIFAPVNKGKYASVVIGHDDENLSYVHIDDLVARGDTVSFTADFAFDTFESIAAPADSFDFRTVDKLLYNLIQTADLREFHITGALTLSIPVISDPTVNIDAKVKILDDGSTVAAIKLTVPYVSAVVAAGLTHTESYIYFADNRLYFVADIWDNNAWWDKDYYKTEYTSATVDEFLANPMDYLFFLVRMWDTIKKPIVNAINKGGDGTPSKNPADILTAYSYANNTLNATVDLGKLAGNSDLSAMTVTLGGTADGYIRSVDVQTEFAGTVGMHLHDTTLVNISTDESGNVVRGENGKPAKENIGAVSFGRNGAFQNLGLSGNIDNLKEDLAKIFPVEAAEAKASIAQEKAEKATAAKKAAKKADDAVLECATALDTATKNAKTVHAKYDKITEEMFGYERAQAQIKNADRALKQAQEDLAAAQDARVQAVDNAIQAAKTAYAAADEAANAANAALHRNKSLDHGKITDVRAYAATGNAALYAIAALDAADEARVQAKAIAEGAGDTCAELLQNIADTQKETDAARKRIAANAAASANTACANTVTVTEQARANTATALAEAKADDGKWVTVSQNASSTLSAINAMLTTDRAATQAALLSEDANLQSIASQNAEKVAATAQTAATDAATAAIQAADNIARIGKAYADNAKSAAKGDPQNTTALTTSALAYAQYAATTADTAQTATSLLKDETLTAQAATAATTATEAKTYIAETLLQIAKDVADAYTQYAENLSPADLSGMQNVNTFLQDALVFSENISKACGYLTESNADTTAYVDLAVGDAATTVLTQCDDAVLRLAQAEQNKVTDTSSNSAQGLIKNAQKNYRESLTEKAARKVSEISLSAKALSEQTEQFLTLVIRAYQTANVYMDASAKATLHATLTAVTSDSAPLKSAYTVLSATAAAQKDFAKQVTDDANKFKVIGTTARELAAQATSDANESASAVNRVNNMVKQLTVFTMSLAA